MEKQNPTNTGSTNTGQGINEQHPGQEAQNAPVLAAPTSLPHALEPFEAILLAERLRSVAAAIEANPAKLEEIRALIAAHPKQFAEAEAALKSIAYPAPTREHLLDVDWQEIGFVIGCILLV